MEAGNPRAMSRSLLTKHGPGAVRPQTRFSNIPFVLRGARTLGLSLRVWSLMSQHVQGSAQMPLPGLVSGAPLFKYYLIHSPRPPAALFTLEEPEAHSA